MTSIWDAKIAGRPAEFLLSLTAPAIAETLKASSYDYNSASIDKFTADFQARPQLAGPFNTALANTDTQKKFSALAEKNNFGDVLGQILADPNNITSTIDKFYAADFSPANTAAASKTAPQKTADAKSASPANASASAQKPAATSSNQPAQADDNSNAASAAPAAPAKNSNPAPGASASDASSFSLAGLFGGGSGGIMQKIGGAFQGFMSLLQELPKILPMILSALGAAISGGGFAGLGSLLGNLFDGSSKEMNTALGSVSALFGGDQPAAAPESNTPTTKEHPSVQTANNLYRTASLGFGINDEEGKAPKGATYTQESNGLYKVDMKMPDGSEEHWRQTDLMTDAKTGVKFMAYERTNADGSLFKIGNKPQVLIESVGNIGTQQDIDAFQKIVKGQDAHELFDQTSKFTQTWVDRAHERYGSTMPDITLGAHSMGAYTVGAITKTLSDNKLTPGQTIEVEPVGAGAGIEFLAKNDPALAAKLTNNVYSFRDKDTFFAAPGGQWEHANSMVGTTYQYANPSNSDAGGFPGNILADHSLALPANLLQQNVNGFNRTPSLDISAQQLAHDAPLPAAQQQSAELRLGGFTVYTEATGGSPSAANIDLSEKLASASVPQKPNGADLKSLRQQSAVKIGDDQAPAKSATPQPVIVKVNSPSADHSAAKGTTPATPQKQSLPSL